MGVKTCETNPLIGSSDWLKQKKMMKLPRISSASVLLGVMVLSNKIKDHQPNKYELSNSGKGFDITNKV